MNRLLTGAVLILLLAGCRKETPISTAPIRETKEILYVSADQLVVRERPDAASTELMKLNRGETVSVVGEQAGWKEIKLPPDRFGWAEAQGLVASSEEAIGAGGTSAVEFIKAPAAVYRQGASGEIVLEATVSTDGVVTNIRTLRNTTGSAELEQLNAASLQRSSFRPLMVKGQRKPFVYEYRVEY